MSREQVYLKAAERIAEELEEYSCNAVRLVSGGNRRPEWFYASIMSPTKHRDLMISDMEEAVYDCSMSSAARNFRVLLLCMMAAACDDLEEGWPDGRA